MAKESIKCRCGQSDNFVLKWQHVGKWELVLNCCECGAVYMIAQSENENITVKELVDGGYCNYNA